ncbi:MAG: LacI family DNA-binding transcriptional regulator, partial [Oscillospiraceae bacterium]|nr:LacI family DNA-binding transcriptional regulator [Oscillospiraceae bacterium]
MSTIRDVAAHAGVSIATVSRVMNNDTTYKITEETRDRVWKAIVELNYKAAASRRKAASAEARPSVKKVGCVIKLRGGKYSDPYYLSLLSGMENYLLSHHVEVSFVRTWNELENSEVLLRIFS